MNLSLRFGLISYPTQHISIQSLLQYIIPYYNKGNHKYPSFNNYGTVSKLWFDHSYKIYHLDRDWAHAHVFLCQGTGVPNIKLPGARCKRLESFLPEHRLPSIHHLFTLFPNPFLREGCRVRCHSTVSQYYITTRDHMIIAHVL